MMVSISTLAGFLAFAQTMSRFCYLFDLHDLPPFMEFFLVPKIGPVTSYNYFTYSIAEVGGCQGAASGQLAGVDGREMWYYSKKTELTAAHLPLSCHPGRGRQEGLSGPDGGAGTARLPRPGWG
jgi:hypothetical protein